MSTKTQAGKKVIMKPVSVDEAAIFAEGFSRYPIMRTLSIRAAMSLEMEEQWIRDSDKDSSKMGWGIYVDGELVGNTGFDGIDNRRATSGCCIFRDDLWGQGIISAVHLARSYYGVQVLGLEAVDSYVFFGNDASLKALLRVGYAAYGVKIAEQILNGKRTHAHQLLWVNPNARQWNAFWDGPIPDQYANKFAESRKRARLALRQAEKNVTFL
ncbi:MAG: GNAT family protein [bacterium]